MEEETGVTPKALLDKPKLGFAEQWYFDVFFDLSGSRRSSMGGLMPIPYSELVGYCQYYEITELEEKALLAKYLRAMDLEYLDIQSEKRDADSKANQAK